ncbi:helix-turn-helix transcriptional regulator [filamentous cyanobacterium LEGE 11480]|uniref:Helix-turn-helix transcriptional regulator n=2 Tax=Romeriopsis TaxID=2992131 RepID=A0A928VVL4_9CYAN|nr:helix-turn-helix transcriptional regulator [Romeriopsis navalis LEGE 11480]
MLQAIDENQQSEVVIRAITQATTATFTDLYFRHTFLFFIQMGSKRVLCPTNGELIGNVGDMMIFPPNSMVTMENRPVLDRDYRAVGVSFSNDLVEAVFSDGYKAQAQPPGIQMMTAKVYEPSHILDIIQATLEDATLPEAIRCHRLLEPLVWIKSNDVVLTPHQANAPLSQVRALLETDLSHPWRSKEVAEHFAMSEATMRRWLARSGERFSKILQNTRLESGLNRLQTTDMPIAEIALECGFKTPSHFSDSFKQRFGINPSQIRYVEE